MHTDSFMQSSRHSMIRDTQHTACSAPCEHQVSRSLQAFADHDHLLQQTRATFVFFVNDDRMCALKPRTLHGASLVARHLSVENRLLRSSWLPATLQYLLGAASQNTLHAVDNRQALRAAVNHGLHPLRPGRVVGKYAVQLEDGKCIPQHALLLHPCKPRMPSRFNFFWAYGWGFDQGSPCHFAVGCARHSTRCAPFTALACWHRGLSGISGQSAALSSVPPRAQTFRVSGSTQHATRPRSSHSLLKIVSKVAALHKQFPAMHHCVRCGRVPGRITLSWM